MSKEMGGEVLWVNNPMCGQAVSFCVLVVAPGISTTVTINISWYNTTVYVMKLQHSLEKTGDYPLAPDFFLF